MTAAESAVQHAVRTERRDGGVGALVGGEEGELGAGDGLVESRDEAADVCGPYNDYRLKPWFDIVGELSRSQSASTKETPLSRLGRVDAI